MGYKNIRGSSRRRKGVEQVVNAHEQRLVFGYLLRTVVLMSPNMPVDT